MKSNGIVIVAGVVIVAAGAFFAVQQAGWLGAQASGLSEEDVATALAAHAEEINVPDGVRYDDWSRLTQASVDGQTIHITGESLLDADQLGDDYIDLRTPQAVNKICRDDEMRAVSEGGATFIYTWNSADGVELGTVTAAPDFCETNGA